MSFPTIFANLAAGTQPASLLDAMFNLCGGMGNIPTTPTGTNAITLAPVANFYQPAAYANYQMVTWKQPATTTGAVTVQLGGLAFVKLFMPTGIQANAGDITLGTKVTAIFASDLDTGAGGFIVLNATTPSVVQPVQGTYKNLHIDNGGTPDSQIAVSADELMLENASGGAAKIGGGGGGVSFTINITAGAGGTPTANGMDGSALSSNTFYSVWAIYNGTTAAGLTSTSASAPTLPAGYTWKARIGWVRTSGLVGAPTTALMRTKQVGRQARYVVATGITQSAALPQIATGNVGSIAVPTWVSQTVVGSSGATAFLPTTAIAGFFLLQAVGGAGGSTNGQAMLAPNGSYGPMGDATNPPPFQITDHGNGIGHTLLCNVVLESTAVFFASLTTGNAILGAAGWEDNI